MNFISHFGDRLKNERKRLGLSQADAADKAGVSREMWGKYERANENKSSLPGAPVLAALDNMGADVLYILTGRTRHCVNEPSNEYRVWTSDELQQEVAGLLAGLHIDEAELWMDTVKRNANKARRARMTLPDWLSTEDAEMLERLSAVSKETRQVIESALRADEKRRDGKHPKKAAA